MRKPLWTALFSIALLASACGDPSPAPDPAGQPDGHGPLAGADTLYSCGGTGSFAGGSLEGPGDVEDENSPLGDALRKLRSDMDGVSAEEGWREVWEGRDQVLLVAPNPGGDHPYESALFQRTGKTWEPQGWGDCSPAVIVGKRSPVLWRLEEPPTDDSTEFRVVLEERACSGGRALDSKNLEVDVEYLDDRIGILVSAEPLGNGMYTCPLNPSSFTIELDEPVDGRRLVDRSVYPPALRDG